MKYIPNAIKFGTQSRPSSLIINLILEIFIKFGSQNKSNMLIMNVLTEIDDLNPNFGLTIEVLSDFMKFSIKNKWNIRIYIYCLDSGQISFKN